MQLGHHTISSPSEVEHFVLVQRICYYYTSLRFLGLRLRVRFLEKHCLFHTQPFLAVFLLAKLG